MGNTLGDYELKCPYCGVALEPTKTIPIGLSPGERITTDCPGCSKKFEASFDHVFNTLASCEMNNEEHNYQPDDNLNIFEPEPKYFTCLLCGKSKGHGNG